MNTSLIPSLIENQSTEIKPLRLVLPISKYNIFFGTNSISYYTSIIQSMLEEFRLVICLESFQKIIPQ